MDRKYKVGGYVKLAKLWERSKDVAVAYHSSYYAERFRDDVDKVVENPMIGAIPSRNEVQRELDDLLMSM